MKVIYYWLPIEFNFILKKILELIDASYLSDKIKRNYKQAYQTRLKKLLRD